MLTLRTMAKSVSHNLEIYELATIATVFHVSDSSNRLWRWDVGKNQLWPVR